jgi:hypothetical protein
MLKIALNVDFTDLDERYSPSISKPVSFVFIDFCGSLSSKLLG